MITYMYLAKKIVLTNYLQHLMGDKLLHGKGCGIDEVLYRVLPTFF